LNIIYISYIIVWCLRFVWFLFHKRCFFAKNSSLFHTSIFSSSTHIIFEFHWILELLHFVNILTVSVAQSLLSCSCESHILWEVDEYRGHIICSNTVICVWREYIREHVLYWFGYIALSSKFALDFIDFLLKCFNAFLIRKAIPDTVTCQTNKLVIISSILNSNIRIWGHSLFFRSQARLIFVLEVTESSTKGKITIDSWVLDHMVGFFNSFHFFCIVRFMIKA